MTDDTNRPHDETLPPGGEPAEPGEAPAQDAGSGGEPAAPQPGAESRRTEAREWLAQLQVMIDRVAGEAAPVARDVAAKAAELAAVAGDKAGPFARRAAEVTDDLGTRMAERSRRLAEDLRHHAAEGGEPPPADPAPEAGATAAPDEPTDPGAG